MNGGALGADGPAQGVHDPEQLKNWLDEQATPPDWLAEPALTYAATREVGGAVPFTSSDDARGQ